MGAALGWGLLSASSLVIGSLIALWIRIPLRVIGLIMGFGAGVLIRRGRVRPRRRGGREVDR
jgi:ZIP family zinc transporter